LESGRLLSVTLLAWTSRTLAQAHLSQNILLKNDRMLTMPIGKTSS
jgi:hypothetical protein